MTGIEWFAFVVLPCSVVALGACLAWGGLKLIDRADRHHRAEE
jgi:hypothetical protein